MDDKRLTRIEEKLDDTNDHLSSIDVTLAEQSLILKEHQRRSLANERIAATLADELKPVILHVAMVRLSLKILTYLLSCGIITAISRFIWLYIK